MTYQRPCAEWAEMLAISHPEKDLSPSEYAALEEHVAHCSRCFVVRERYRFVTERVCALSTDEPLPYYAHQSIDHEKHRRIAEVRRYVLPPRTIPRRKQVAFNARRSFGRAIDAAFIVLVFAGLIVSAQFLFQHHPTTTTGGANATATANALAAAIDRASNPQDIYRAVTSSIPVLDDPLDHQDANKWDEYDKASGSCAFIGGAYRAYASEPYVTECYAQRTTSSSFAFQVQMKLIQGDIGGLIFGTGGTNSKEYRFAIYTGTFYPQYYDLFTPLDGKRVVSGYSTAIKLGRDQLNLLTVIVSKGTIYLYINTQFVDQTNVANGISISGKIGVFASDNQNPTTVEYSHTKLWTW